MGKNRMCQIMSLFMTLTFLASNAFAEQLNPAQELGASQIVCYFGEEMPGGGSAETYFTFDEARQVLFMGKPEDEGKVLPFTVEKIQNDNPQKILLSGRLALDEYFQTEEFMAMADEGKLFVMMFLLSFNSFEMFIDLENDEGSVFTFVAPNGFLGGDPNEKSDSSGGMCERLAK